MVAAAAAVAVVAAAAVAALPGELAAFAKADDPPTTLTDEVLANEVPGRARHRRPGQSMCSLRCGRSNAQATLMTIEWISNLV